MESNVVFGLSKNTDILSFSSFRLFLFSLEVCLDNKKKIVKYFMIEKEMSGISV